MKTIIITPVLVIALLVGCGPSAQQQLQKRVCEMYEDAGGGRETSLSEWLKWFNTPEKLAEMKANNARNADNPYITPETLESRAESQFAYGRERNERARSIVSVRLNISLRETDEAMRKCYAKTVNVEKKVSPPAAVKKEPDPLSDAADAERRTKDLLQRTEGWVAKPYTAGEVTEINGPRKLGILFGSDFFTTSYGRIVIEEERSVFAVGDKFAFVASFGRDTGSVDFTLVRGVNRVIEDRFTINMDEAYVVASLVTMPSTK